MASECFGWRWGLTYGFHCELILVFGNDDGMESEEEDKDEG